MDSDGQNNGRPTRGRRSAKRPAQMKFMFIDSTSHGQNAKPDKAVRSFVMHQARRAKPWSTRLKSSPSPRPESPASGPRSAGLQGRSADERTEIYASSSSSACTQAGGSTPVIWHDHGLGSPALSTSHGAIGSLPLTPISGVLCDRPDCNGQSCKQMHATRADSQALVKPHGIATGVVDPFDTMAVRMDLKMSSLVDHFVKIMAPHMVPIDMHHTAYATSAKWIANSMTSSTSAPYTYAMITSSALAMQALRSTAIELDDPLYYKARAIEEINSLLTDPRTRIDDNNIAAVFMLLCIEESQLAPGSNKENDGEWTAVQRAIHLHGLRTMIEQRGGLAALGSNRCLQVFILMHSIAHAISTFQRPYAVLVDSTDTPQQYDSPSFRPRPTPTRTLRQFQELNLDPGLFTIIPDIIAFAGDVSSWFSDSTTPLDPLELQKHACLLNYRLFDWFILPQESPTTHAPRTPIDQAIALSFIIFLVKISHPFNPSYPAFVLTPVKKLRAALAAIPMFSWSKTLNLFLWILTIGAQAAAGTQEYGFFVQYCRIAFAGPQSNALEPGARSAEALLGRMRSVLWCDLLLDDEARGLWTRMGILEDGEGRGGGGPDGVVTSPDVREDDVVGLLTSSRFFKEPGL